jgi:hypothetical protein
MQDATHPNETELLMYIGVGALILIIILVVILL